MFLLQPPFAPIVLICDFPKPQRGERCIVRIDATSSKPQRGERCIVRIDPTNTKPQRGERCINALTFYTQLTPIAEYAFGILHWLVKRTYWAGHKGQIILEILLILKILVQTKDAFPAYPSDKTKILLS